MLFPWDPQCPSQVSSPLSGASGAAEAQARLASFQQMGLRLTAGDSVPGSAADFGTKSSARAPQGANPGAAAIVALLKRQV